MSTGPGRRRAPAGVVSLPEVTTALLEQARTHHSRRAARTVVAGATLRATVMALAAGADLAEHDPPRPRPCRCSAARCACTRGNGSGRCRPGRSCAIPPERHGVHADTDAVFLLTVALQ